ncbi:NAD(P)H-binding protein [Ornithinimicrobium sp. W1665]|uniref:NAD(P)H-binding protein n=1 Tax=Ornithinimicrobium sp. W1665 TaxID=3416666 RepID=UPI003D6C2D6C
MTGATGYVGGRLVPRLLDEGHEVRTTTHDPSKEGPWFSDRVETVEMDIKDADQVDAAIEGVDAVYYLIHGMGGGDDFAQKDREAAQHVARALTKHGTERVVYLSGIVPPVDEDELSEHISSRLQVEEILSSTPATAITLRAAVLMGSGSTSFEIIRQVSERMPLQTVPTWMNSDVQPIAVVDAIEALVGALSAEVGTRSYDIGGPDRVPYAELLDRYAPSRAWSAPRWRCPSCPPTSWGPWPAASPTCPRPPWRPWSRACTTTWSAPRRTSAATCCRRGMR